MSKTKLVRDFDSNNQEIEKTPSFGKEGVFCLRNQL